MSEEEKTTKRVGTQDNVSENANFSNTGDGSKPNVAEQKQELREATIDNKNNVSENAILADVKDTRNNEKEKDENPEITTTITNPSLSGVGSVELNKVENEENNNNNIITNGNLVVNKTNNEQQSAPYNLDKRLIDSYGVGNLENRDGVLYANYRDGNLHRVTDYNGNYVLKDGSVIDKDGNNIVTNDQTKALSNRFRDRIFEWMDTYGADSITRDKLRTIMHEEGMDGWKAYRKTNNKMGNIAFTGEMLRELKNEYFLSNPKRAAAANAIDVNYMDGTVTTSLKDGDGNAISVDAIEALEFIKKAQKIIGKNGYIAPHLDPDKTRELQKLCKEYSDENGDLISQFLKEGEEFKIDEVAGNQTFTVFTGLLSMLPDELLNSTGLKRYPDGSINKAEYSDEWLSNDLENNKLSKDKEFDLKRNKRIRNLQSFMSILANIGDTIKGAGGAKVEDRSEEINNVFDKIDKQYDAINSDYNARIDALQKAQREESDKRKQWQLKLAEMEITHQMNKELRGLDFANQMAVLAKQQNFQRDENAKSRNFEAGQNAANRKSAFNIANMKSETSGDKNQEALFYYKGEPVYVDKREKDATLNRFNAMMRDKNTLLKLGLNNDMANTISGMVGGVAGNTADNTNNRQALSYIIKYAKNKEELENFIAEGVSGYVKDGSKGKSNTGTGITQQQYSAISGGYYQNTPTQQVTNNGIYKKLGNVR